MKISETYGAYPEAQIELLVEEDHFRIRVNEPNNKASIFLYADELEHFGLACVEMALQIKLEPGK